MTRIGTRLSPEMQEAMKNLLVELIDVSAWSHNDILGIDNLVIEHCLCMDLESRKIR